MFLAILVALGGGLGVTMGAHRLYSHKTFKAKPALRLALVLLQTMAGQVSGRPLYIDGRGRAVQMSARCTLLSHWAEHK